MNVEEMLQREDQAWSGLVEAFDLIPDERRDVQGVVPGWSTKDLVWHCGYWAGYVADVFERALRGEGLPPDQDWDAVNDMVIVEGRSMTWDQIIVRSEEHRARVRTSLQALPEVTADLAEEFSGETYEHYEEHAAEIRAFAAA
jgi:hypothetical protein